VSHREHSVPAAVHPRMQAPQARALVLLGWLVSGCSASPAPPPPSGPVAVRVPQPSDGPDEPSEAALEAKLRAPPPPPRDDCVRVWGESRCPLKPNWRVKLRDEIVRVDGPRDRGEIWAGIANARSAVRECFELPGVVEVRILVDGKGPVLAASGTGSAAADCAAKVLRAAKFPRGDGGRTTVVIRYVGE